LLNGPQRLARRTSLGAAGIAASFAARADVPEPSHTLM
jgi:hypothetical protein